VLLAGRWGRRRVVGGLAVERGLRAEDHAHLLGHRGEVGGGVEPAGDVGGVDLGCRGGGGFRGAAHIACEGRRRWGGALKQVAATTGDGMHRKERTDQPTNERGTHLARRVHAGVVVLDDHVGRRCHVHQRRVHGVALGQPDDHGDVVLDALKVDGDRALRLEEV